MTTHHKYFSTAQFKNVIKDVHDVCHYQSVKGNHVEIPKLTFKGTVKLHGTNASIYNILNTNEVVAQSKNNVITVEKDHAGFANHIHANNNVAQKLFEGIKAQFPEKLDTHTAVIYGEWCGGNIQKKVALHSLEKMFVVFGVKLVDNTVSGDEYSETWLKEEHIQKMFAAAGDTKDAKIYSIYDFPTWTVEIDFKSPQLAQNKLIDITMAVEKECPVGKAFGVRGVGEGVVWKCVSEHPVFSNRNMVFKVKGEEHSVSKVKTLAAVDTEKVESINKFVDFVVTENRLKQGVEYLVEQHAPIELPSLPIFLKWICNDCIKEEHDVMEKSELPEKEVMKKIAFTARAWFIKMVDELDKEMAADRISENSAPRPKM